MRIFTKPKPACLNITPKTPLFVFPVFQYLLGLLLPYYMKPGSGNVR